MIHSWLEPIVKVPRVVLITLMLAVAACRGEPANAPFDQAKLEAMVDSLMPGVAEITGMAFKETPRSAMRSREEVREFLLNKLAEELPPERLEGIGDAYRLLGLLPDTLDLSALFVDLYTEQVAGFYEPDSSTLYAVEGADRTQLPLILAHELVHALQHQYVPLDSIMNSRGDADRLAAAQAILEGHATLASIMAMAPDADILSSSGSWDMIRTQLSTPQAGMEVLNRAPLVIRTGLLFPYLHGAEFMRWFRINNGTRQPFGAAMPQSTEQILHPARYQAGDLPITLRFNDDSTDVLHEDTFGEFEMLVLRSALAGIDAVATDLPLGWGGDRMRVYRTDQGSALVWYSVWDEAVNADGFHERIASKLVERRREGYRTVVERFDQDSLPWVRVVIAPTTWSAWDQLPGVVVGPAGP
jgi:hypothetical protein